MRQYVLTAPVLGRLKYYESKRTENQNTYRNPLLQCNKCRKDLVVGDQLVGSRNQSNSKRYHLDCAKRLNIVS